MSSEISVDTPEATGLERFVNMSNALTRAAQGLKLTEKRVISSAIAQSDSVELRKLSAALGPNQGWKVKLTAQDYAQTFGVDQATAYVQLREAADSIFNKYIRTVELTRRGDKERKYRWVTGNTYHHGEGWVEINFAPEVAPFLLGLRKEFTTYKLKHTAALRSVYSWRLMEMFAQYRDTGLVRISFEDFCHAMEAPPSCLKDFGQLRRRIIDPAVQELTGKDGLLIEWKATKQGGRKVTGLEFTFAPNPQLFLV